MNFVHHSPRRAGEILHHTANTMSEPATTGAAGLIGWKFFAGLFALGAAGVLGGAIAAAFDPPKTKRVMFAQFTVAGVGSLMFGPVTLRLLDHWLDFVSFAGMNWLEFAEWAAPVYLVIGALSWGIFGALAQLRRIVHERGAEELWRRGGGPAQGAEPPQP